MQRFCGLLRLPTPRTVGRWLREFRAHHLLWVQELNAQLAAATIRRAGLGRLTIDVDGSVVSTGQQVQWAQRGYNPHHRKVPSYYPITAYEAQSGQILRVQNRPGNVHDGKAARGFLQALFAQLAATLTGYLVEFRMDGAFFRRDIIELLERYGAEYAIKVPFYPWVRLKEKVQQTYRWERGDDPRDGGGCFEWWYFANAWIMRRRRTSSSTCLIQPTGTTSTQRWSRTRR